MIKKDEIRQKAKEFDISIVNLQRDYLFGWILSTIYSKSDLGKKLILKGGNVFRKAYFSETRFSDDLDFTTDSKIDSNWALNQFNEVCGIVQKLTGVQFIINENRVKSERVIELRKNERNKTVYKIRLYFVDFSGEQGEITISIRVDITDFDKIYLPINKRILIHPYSDREQCRTEISCLQLEEALANKLKCLLQRRKASDLFDLSYSLLIKNDLNINKSDLVHVFLKKTIFEQSPVAAKELFLQLPFEGLKILWKKYIICPKKARDFFHLETNLLVEMINGLFENFNYGHHKISHYFPARDRDLILDAGKNSTLLKINYQNRTRMVEPYSLVFKKRKDGLAREYLYVYDQTGGNSSGPGVKTFVNEGVVNIEQTEEKFDSKYEIELSKMGEKPGEGYFSTSFKSAGKSRSKSSIKRGVNYQYKVACPYCNKEFYRKKLPYSTKLNVHKDGYGNKCYGKTGYIV
jgi:predicted nucleotidyltransferase component of viral defense system